MLGGICGGACYRTVSNSLLSPGSTAVWAEKRAREGSPEKNACPLWLWRAYCHALEGRKGRKELQKCLRTSKSECHLVTPHRHSMSTALRKHRVNTSAKRPSAAFTGHSIFLTETSQQVFFFFHVISSANYLNKELSAMSWVNTLRPGACTFHS